MNKMKSNEFFSDNPRTDAHLHAELLRSRDAEERADIAVIAAAVAGGMDEEKAIRLFAGPEAKAALERIR